MANDINPNKKRIRHGSLSYMGIKKYRSVEFYSVDRAPTIAGHKPSIGVAMLNKYAAME